MRRRRESMWALRGGRGKGRGRTTKHYTMPGTRSSHQAGLCEDDDELNMASSPLKPTDEGDE